ncbi:hypothetical protein [Mycobacteroides abscessus]|uniref:hypothetical protein n=1 Tax=Mycobacteroides abscessus TaxID=36809 RepID=UPI0014903E0E|nr:hypothetical protein [Mycobacteroides abscessus]
MTRTRNEVDHDDLITELRHRGREAGRGEIDLYVEVDPSMPETRCYVLGAAIYTDVVYARDADGNEKREEDCDVLSDRDYNIAAGVDYDYAVSALADKVEAMARALTERVTAAARRARQHTIAAEVEFWTAEFISGSEDFAEPGTAWHTDGEDLVYRRPDLGVDFVARRGLDGLVTVTTRTATA